MERCTPQRQDDIKEYSKIKDEGTTHKAQGKRLTWYLDQFYLIYFLTVVLNVHCYNSLIHETVDLF
jgi:hypothetical protein